MPSHPVEQQPCDDCGTTLRSGSEPNSPRDDYDAWQAGETTIRVDWCPNLDCPSNHALPGLTRVNLNHYICTACGADLSGPMSQIFDHRRTH